MKPIKLIKPILFSGFACLLFCSFISFNDRLKNKPAYMINAKINKLNWLIGSWENSSSEGISYEIWKIKNDSVYSGVSYYVKEKDTLSTEKILLEQHGDDLYYIPTVSGQNNDLAVTFKLTSMENNNFVFENPAHDFPQKITYLQVSDDSLLAEISGFIKGEMKAVKFPMARSKK